MQCVPKAYFFAISFSNMADLYIHTWIMESIKRPRSGSENIGQKLSETSEVQWLRLPTFQLYKAAYQWGAKLRSMGTGWTRRCLLKIYASIHSKTVPSEMKPVW